jgi:hypothetical protein
VWSKNAAFGFFWDKEPSNSQRGEHHAHPMPKTGLEGANGDDLGVDCQRQQAAEPAIIDGVKTRTSGAADAFREKPDRHCCNRSLKAIVTQTCSHVRIATIVSACALEEAEIKPASPAYSLKSALQRG